MHNKTVEYIISVMPQYIIKYEVVAEKVYAQQGKYNLVSGEGSRVHRRKSMLGANPNLLHQRGFFLCSSAK